MAEFEICPSLDQCLQRLTIEKNLAVAISRQRALNNRAIQNFHLYCFDENQRINTYLMAMYVNRRFLHRKKVHVLTERFFETGLLRKWTMDSKVKGSGIAKQQIHKLSVQILLGALFVYALTFFWAIAALIAEIIVHKLARRPNAAVFWILFECVFDNERYAWRLNNTSSRAHSMLFTFIVVICYVISIILVYISLEHNF